MFWLFLALNSVLIIPSFVIYYCLYYPTIPDPDWRFPLATVLTVVFKAWQTYVVILFIKSPQMEYYQKVSGDETPLTSLGVGVCHPPDSWTRSIREREKEQEKEQEREREKRQDIKAV